MIIATCKMYDSQTNSWTKEISLECRNREEAMNWLRFNRDYAKDFRINGESVKLGWM